MSLSCNADGLWYAIDADQSRNLSTNLDNNVHAASRRPSGPGSFIEPLYVVNIADPKSVTLWCAWLWSVARLTIADGQVCSEDFLLAQYMATPNIAKRSRSEHIDDPQPNVIFFGCVLLLCFYDMCFRQHNHHGCFRRL